MQSVNMLSVNLLSVTYKPFILSVIMLNVAAPVLKELARDKRSSLLGYGFITFSYYL